MLIMTISRRASSIQVAGCIDGDQLLFSVRDDGCGHAFLFHTRQNLPRMPISKVRGSPTKHS